MNDQGGNENDTRGKRCKQTGPVEEPSAAQPVIGKVVLQGRLAASTTARTQTTQGSYHGQQDVTMFLDKHKWMLRRFYGKTPSSNRDLPCHSDNMRAQRAESQQLPA